MVYPTLIWYIGSQTHPWQIGDDELCDVLQRIWNHIYGKRLPYTVKTGESIHGLVSTFCSASVVLLMRSG